MEHLKIIPTFLNIIKLMAHNYAILHFRKPTFYICLQMKELFHSSLPLYYFNNMLKMKKLQQK